MGETRGREAIQSLVDTWGGSLDRWPDDARRQITPHLDDPDARRALEEARRLDDRLDAHPAISDRRCDAVAAAVASRIAATPRGTSSLSVQHLLGLLFAPAGAAVGAVAASVVVGVLFGLAAPIGAGAEQDISALLIAGDGAAPLGVTVQ